MTESKMCPLDGEMDCCETKCAWYDSDRQQCAVMTICVKLAEIERKTKKA